MLISTQTATSITISVNGTPQSLQAKQSLESLLRQIDVADHKGIAIALNDEVVVRADWAAVLLSDGDNILIITATQGG